MVCTGLGDDTGTLLALSLSLSLTHTHTHTHAHLEVRALFFLLFLLLLLLLPVSDEDSTAAAARCRPLSFWQNGFVDRSGGGARRSVLGLSRCRVASDEDYTSSTAISPQGVTLTVSAVRGRVRERERDEEEV